MTLSTSVRSMLGRGWRASAPLTAAGLVLLAVAPLALLGMLLDPREIGGAPAWLKPAKFTVSTGLFCLTMSWMLSYLPGWPRLRRIVGTVTAAVFVVEVAIIGLQAWRGTASHFNVATPLDGVLFGVMGAAIAVQTVMTILVAVALWRQTFDDRPLGWALRLGLAVSIAGASIGGLMTRPTDAQLADARAGRSLTRVGAHTVGAPDGGPGMPGTGWSRDHGDLRVAHFVGLHAMQILPIVALLVRRGSETARARLVIAAAASHATLFALLLWQALRGIPVARPDAETAAALAVWAAATLAAVVWRRDPVRPRVAEVAL